MAAPIGNKNAAKGRLFEQALMREIKQRDITAGDGETLRQIAAKWVDAALRGDIPTGEKIRDTIDGKPQQRIDIEQRTTLEHVGLSETDALINEAAGIETPGPLTQSLPH